MKRFEIHQLISGFLLTTFIFLSSPIVANADTFDEPLKENTKFTALNEDYLSPTHYETININGIDVDLSKTFVNRDDALTTFKQLYSEEINFIKTTFNLQELSLDNYAVYYTTFQSLNDLVDVNTIPTKLNENIFQILKFFDIFENDEANGEIKNLNSKLISQNLNSNDTLSEANSILNSINLLLPYDAPNVAPPSIQPAAFIGLNVDNAINYAINYAYTPNYNYKYFSDNDCTNFVSQILSYGGIPQNSSWYYNSSLSYATNWVNANAFARYWGVKYNSTDHYTFSSFIDRGDVIVADWGDGVWDHAGFVTAADSYAATYNGKYYYDYKVAQHSTNYHAWTSTSENGWENIENNSGAMYGVLRK